MSPLILIGITFSSCSWLGIKNPFADDQRPAQMVEGSRHAPILNPDTVPPNPQMHGYVHGTEPPQVQPVREGLNPDYYDNSKALSVPPTPIPSSIPATGPNSNANTNPNNPNPAPAVAKGNGVVSEDTDPYDYYDASGNPEPPPSDNALSQPGHFLNHMFGSGNTDSETRKPLPGNPDLSNDMTPATPPVSGRQSSIAPLAPMPASKPQNIPVVVTAEQTLSEPTPEIADAASEEQNISPKDSRESLAASTNVLPTASQTSVQSDGEPSSSQSWFGRWLDKHSGNEQDPARSAPTPNLSSLPPTPPEFQAVKDDKIQNMQDLQGYRIEAAQEKQQLASEPSELQPQIQPQTQAQTLPPVNMPPAAAVSSPPANPPVSSEQTIVIGHAGDAASAGQQPVIVVSPPAANNAGAATDTPDYVSALQQSKTPAAAQ